MHSNDTASAQRTVEIFVRHLPERMDADGEGLAVLQAALEEGIERAHSTWPEICLSCEEFVPELARRVPAQLNPLEALEAMRIPDLFLACACAQGDCRAAEAYNTWCRPGIRLVLRRQTRAQALVEDLEQMVYERVFIGTPERGPRIAQYAARGDLRKWLQTVALRTAQNVLRRQARERPLSPSLVEGLIPAVRSPEDSAIKSLYRDDFSQAFQQALAGLSPRQRNLLRFRLNDRMSLSELADLHKVHRVTISRWISDIRAQLRTDTRERLARSIQSDSAELDSLMTALQSQLDLSIERLLT